MLSKTGAQVGTVLLLAVVLGCTGGGEGGGEKPPVQPPVAPPPVEPTAAELAGTWTGMGTFRQNIAGKISTAEVPINLTFDARGVPGSLPALGLVSPWRVYTVGGGSGPDNFPRAALTAGGTIWAYCIGEADGSANELQVQPGQGADPARPAHWSYQARYHFADLIDYRLYDYAQPGAPEVALDATDDYALSTGAGQQPTLVVRGRASGTTVATAQGIELSFDARLVRGEGKIDISCGHRR